MDSKKLLKSILFLFLTIILLITSTFAWFTFNKHTDVNDIIVPVGNYDVDVEIAISKNGSDYISIHSIEKMQFLLYNSIPNDIYEFKIKLFNRSNKSINTNLRMENIRSENSDLDIRNVFYILDGNVYLNGEIKKLPVNSEEEEIIAGQILNRYRFNNLIDNNNSITLFNNYILPVGGEVEIEFAIKYDETTQNVGYQNGIFQISGFFVYFNNV